MSRQTLLASVLSTLVVSTAGCGDCTEEIDRAGVFLRDPGNLSCTTDDDCVVVGTGCHTFDFGVCGQAQLSRGAAATSQWARLSADLEDCERSCDRCDALLLAHCADGACGRDTGARSGAKRR